MTTLDLFVLEDRCPRHFLHNRACGLAQCLCKEKTTPPGKPSKESSGRAIFFRRPGSAAPGGAADGGRYAAKPPLLCTCTIFFHGAPARSGPGAAREPLEKNQIFATLSRR